MIYFISGHRDITEDEFKKYYIPKIDKVIKEDGDFEFVIGDYYGVDVMAQDYICSKGYENFITVYHMCEKPRYFNSDIKRFKGGYQSDIDRDSAMTNESDFDIAFVREGKSNSGTAQNIIRRHLFSI